MDGEDPRWLSMFEQRPILELSGKEAEFEAFGSRLLAHNKHTGNLLCLMDQTASRMRVIIEYRDRKSQPSRSKVEQCCAAIHLTCLFLNYLVSRLGADMIREQLRLPWDWPSAEGIDNRGQISVREESGISTVQELLNEAIEILSSSPLPSFMYEVSFCSANLLLTVFSTQLYAEATSHADNLFMRYVHMICRAQMKAATEERDRDVSWTMPARLMRALITHSVDPALAASVPSSRGILLSLNKSRSEAERRGDGEQEGNFLLLLLQRLLRMGSGERAKGKSSSNSGGKNHEGVDRDNGQVLVSVPDSPVQERCKNLLEILVFNSRQGMLGGGGRKRDKNLFQELFHGMSDRSVAEEAALESGASPAKGKQAVKGINVEFQALLEHLSTTLPSESSVLLLYALLCRHPLFLDFVAGRADRAQTLVTAVLKGLYAVDDSYPVEVLYVLVICLLVLVQSAQLRSLLLTCTVTAPWYKEHFLRDVSLADLALLCTLRTTVFALFRLQDTYLLSNCFAILLDLASHVQHIGCYVSERLAKVLLQLARKLKTGLSAGAADTAQLESVFDSLAILMKLCGTALRPVARESNVHLLYALVHEDEKLSSVFANSDTLTSLQASAMEANEPGAVLYPTEVVALTHTYYQKLQGESGAEHYPTAVRAVEVLASHVRADIAEGGMVDKDTDERHVQSYSYSEGADSAAFFVPLAWATMIRRSPDIHWHHERMNLLDPVASRICEGKDVSKGDRAV